MEVCSRFVVVNQYLLLLYLRVSFANGGPPLPGPSMYPLANTRPVISFVVSRISQFMHAPCQSHFDIVYQILQYLKSYLGLGMFYEAKYQGSLEFYTDTDYDDSSDTHSTASVTCFCSFRENHLISWKSKKQVVVSRSSAQANYRALALGTPDRTSHLL